MSHLERKQLTANQFNSIIIEQPEFQGSSFVYKVVSLTNHSNRFSIHFDDDYDLHFYTLDMPLFISYKIDPASIKWEFSFFEDECRYHINFNFGYACLDLSIEEVIEFLSSLQKVKGYNINNDELFTNNKIKQSHQALAELLENLKSEFRRFLNAHNAEVIGFE